jgi:hypothetical protein
MKNYFRFYSLWVASVCCLGLTAQVTLSNAFKGNALSSTSINYSNLPQVRSFQLSFVQVSCSWSDAYLFVNGTPTISTFTTREGKQYNLSNFQPSPAFKGTGTATWRFPTGETMTKTFSIGFTYFGKEVRFLASDIVFPDNKKFFGPGIEALKQQGILASRENLQNHGYGPKLIDLSFSIEIALAESLKRDVSAYEERLKLESEGRALYHQQNCAAAIPKLEAALAALQSNYVKQQFKLNDSELRNMIAACRSQLDAAQQAERTSSPKPQGQQSPSTSTATTSETSTNSSVENGEKDPGGTKQPSPTNSETNPQTTTQNKQQTAAPPAESRKAANYEKEKQAFEQQQARDAQRAREYEQTKKNTEIAASAGVMAILVHTYIGKLIYTGIPSDENNHWTHTSPHMQMALGYGFGVVPYFQRFGRTDDRFTGGSQNSIFTIDLNGRMNFNFLMAENYGLGVSGNATFGHLLEDYKVEYGFGALGYVGHKNLKLLAEYQKQYVDFTHYSWIDASSRTSAKVHYKVSRLAAGPRISWGDGQGSNLDLLVALDKNTMEQEEVPNELYGSGGPEVYTYGGKIQFWKQNVGLFYAEIFEVPSFDNEQHFMFKAGYLKSLDAFFAKPQVPFNKVVQRHQSRHKLVLSVANPIISWGTLNTSRDTVSSFSNGLGLKLIELEKELNITSFLALSGGVGMSIGRSFQVARPFSNASVGNAGYPREPSYIARGLEADLPLGIQLYPFKRLTSAVWLSGKYQLSYTLYNLNEDLNEVELNPFSTTLRLGLGYDIAWSDKNSYRVGVYYLTSSDVVSAPNSGQLNSIQLQFALLF